MSTQFTNRQWRLPNNENKDKQSNYSMDFDGSQYIDCGDVPLEGVYTISFWINPDVSPSVLYFLFDKRDGFSSNISARVTQSSNNTIRFQIGTTNFSSTDTLTSNSWNNVVLIANGSSSKIYINNGTAATGTLATAPNITDSFFIGTDNAQQSAYFFNGQIDAVSIFNYALSSSQVTTLYGSSSTGIGNPMTLNPVAYYPLGDQDAFNGSNYLVPNIAAEEDDGDIAASYSPYALDFDGANDYINLGTTPIVTGIFTFSLWIKRTSTSSGAASQVIIGKDGQSSNRVFNVFMSLSGVIGFWVSETGSYVSTYRVNTSTLINDTNWHNLIVINNGDNNNNQVFIDGTEASYTLQGTGRTTLYNTTGIATSIGSSANTPTTYAFNGSLSNLSIWSASLTSAQVTEIYSEGIPQNLNNHSAVSSLVSWWQLGSNSSFNTNWTVLDEVAASGNNGTSVNMDEVDIVDGVGSYANGLSSGMGGDEVIGSAPFSDANSLSVNMDVLDRVTDTPS